VTEAPEATGGLRDRVAPVALYLGGFLGPFGGGVLVVLIPELQDVFHASAAEVTAGITVYVLPFAALQLVSGTVGERLGRGPTIRVAYIVYALTSFGAAAATTIAPFLVFRALQGASNAFTSPLLLAALADVAPAERLGRTMGTFASVQTAGMVMAPLCGGLLGALDPRLAFAIPGVVALMLTAAPLPAGTRRAGRAPARLRAAFNRRTGAVASAGLLAFMAINGIAFLVSLLGSDRFGLDATQRGLLLAGFGLSGVLAGRAAGALVDRVGARRVLVGGALASGTMVALMGLAGGVGTLAGAWVLAGAASALTWAALNTLAVQSAPANRGGAISVIGAFKFAGGAIAPLLWLPIYVWHAEAAFALAGAVAAAIALIALALRGTPPVGRPGHTDTQRGSMRRCGPRGR
jgi:MFS family permease